MKGWKRDPMKDKLQSKFNTRQHMQSEDYELFYYSDLHFRSLEAHAHGFREVYFFAEGSVEMEIGGKLHSLKAGDILCVSPGTVHRVIIRDGNIPYRRFVLWLSEKYCRTLPPASRSILEKADRTGYLLRHFDLIEYNIVSGKLLDILEEINSNRFGREDQIRLALPDLLLYLSRKIHEQDHPGTSHADVSVYEALTGYIDAHLDEELSLDALSGRFYVSKYHIAHLFHEKTGFSVHRYIIKKRLDRASAAIRSGMLPTKACIICGFKDYSSFYRAYKKEYGEAPSGKTPYAGAGKMD